jgi:hypothetical protein
LVKRLPDSMRVEYEQYRVAINQGDVLDVHPE